MSEKVKSIFMSAISGKSPDQWPQFLDVACRGDAALRDQVEKFLNAHLAMGSIHFSDTTDVCDPFLFIKPGTEIGRYTVLEQIGEGGMGTVYVAKQKIPMRRTVALKVIKAGMDTRQVVARFEAERQALAMMNHPNIARVLDGGTTEQGRPYFVMELVKGLPITEFCDNQKLDIRKRIELFVEVCGAVQHAHQKGIIHRDLKPSNILVEQHEKAFVPKVIDFGVAKAIGQPLTDESLRTGFTQMLGTPLYMSPEQAGFNAMDIDTRSDVFSLGVVFYELLTGTTPFDRDSLKNAGADQLRKLICEMETPRPSVRITSIDANKTSQVLQNRTADLRQLRRQLHGELDWIVLKALEKDRSRRYESVNALRCDIERYLQGDVVEARPASIKYRLRKFVRKYRGPVIAASLVIACLGLSLVLVVILAARERDLAKRSLAVAQGINSTLAEVAHLRNLAQSDAKNSQVTLEKARSELQRAVALAEAGPSSKDLKEQVRQLQHELELDFQNADLLNIFDEAWIATVNNNPDTLGLAFEKCIPILSKALETRGLLVGETSIEEAVVVINNFPESIRSHLLVALSEWAETRKKMLGVLVRPVDSETSSDSHQSEKFLQLDRNGDRTVAFGLGSVEPLTERKPSMVFNILGPHTCPLLGDVVRLRILHSGQLIPVTYEVVPDRVLSWIKKVIVAADNDPWRHRLRETNELIERKELIIELEQLARESDVSQQPVRILVSLITRLMFFWSYDPALKLAQEVQRQHPDNLVANVILAEVLVKMKPPRLEESVRYLTAAVALCPNSGATHFGLGTSLHKLDRDDEAILEYRETLRITSNFLPPAGNLHQILIKQNKVEEGLEVLRVFVASNPENALAHSDLGKALMAQKRFGQAASALGEAIRLAPNQSLPRSNLALVLEEQGKLDEAILQYRELLQMLPSASINRVHIAKILMIQNKFDDAIQEMREALRLFPDEELVNKTLAWFLVHAPAKNQNAAEAIAYAKKDMTPNTKIINHWGVLGIAYYRNAEWKQAILALEKAIELASTVDISSGDHVIHLLGLAMSHWQLGNKQEAREAYGFALELIAKGPVHDHPKVLNLSVLNRILVETQELLGISQETSAPLDLPASIGTEAKTP